MSSVIDSILTTVKKQLGIDSEYTHFDSDLILLINSTFSTLIQMGIGDVASFSIVDDSAVWGDFVADSKIQDLVKQYVAIKTRLGFDPPTTSYLIDNFKEQLKELEYRMFIYTDSPTAEVFSDE